MGLSEVCEVKSPCSMTRKMRYNKVMGRLLVMIGLLVSFFQPVMANAGRPGGGPTITITTLKDFSVAGSGNPDIIQVQITPAPNPGDQLTFNISGSSYTPVITTNS